MSVLGDIERWDADFAAAGVVPNPPSLRSPAKESSPILDPSVANRRSISAVPNLSSIALSRPASYPSAVAARRPAPIIWS